MAASLLVLVLAGGAALVAFRGSGGDPAVTFAASADRAREVTLADGTRLHLNRGSRVQVRLASATRHVEMSNGEAAFDVAHDPSRPFTITAGDRQVRVVGTEFDIVRTVDRFDIAVRRGVVEIRDADTPAQSPPIARLTAGAAPSPFQRAGSRHGDGHRSQRRIRLDRRPTGLCGCAALDRGSRLQPLRSTQAAGRAKREVRSRQPRLSKSTRLKRCSDV